MILKRKKNASSVSEEAVERKLNLNIKMQRLIANGDSWTYGSELYDPKLVNELDPRDINYGKKLNDLNEDPRNFRYRLTSNYTWHMAQYYRADVINLSVPADNNNHIAERTVDYILSENLSGPDNFVIIGWTAPERNDYYMFKPNDISFRHRIFPDSLERETYPPATRFLEVYLSEMVVAEEYWTRYAKNVFMVESLLRQRNIPYLMFNAFYAGIPMESKEQWQSLPDAHISNQIHACKTIGYSCAKNVNVFEKSHDVAVQLWKTVDPIRWYKKDQFTSSFRTEVVSRLEKPFAAGLHPNESAHKVWAEVLISYIEQHGLRAAPSQK